MSSFRSLSIQDNDVHDQPHDKSPEPETIEMNIPKSQSTYSIEIPNSETLWTVDPRPESSANYFSFTNFAMSLNELESHMTKLQPTDSRLRQDIRKLEHGDVEGANVEKIRLEEKQRDTRKARKSKNGGNDDWQPRYTKFIFNAFIFGHMTSLSTCFFLQDKRSNEFDLVDSLTLRTVKNIFCAGCYPACRHRQLGDNLILHKFN